MTDCKRCSRREALGGLGALVVLGTVPACTARSNVPIGEAAACADGLCLDLTAVPNAPLRMVDGAVLIEAMNDAIVVVRTSQTDVAAVSGICTHEGCQLNWDAGSEMLTCPCHGSLFATTGAVLRGPAGRPVRSYEATLDGDVVTILGT